MHDVDDSWTTVGWESVVERNPDVIVVCNYSDVSAEQKRKFLLSYAPLRNVSAVKHKRIFVLDYVDLVESPRNPSAIVRLGGICGRRLSSGKDRQRIALRPTIVPARSMQITSTGRGPRAGR